jgi:erythromycin esterase-like protein
MRRRNADPARGRELKLVGIDMRDPDGSTRDLVAYLDAVDAREGVRARRRLAPLAAPGGAGMAPLSPGQRQFACAVVADHARLLDRRREEYLAQGGERAWRVARQHAAVLGQSCERSLRPDDGAAIRARAWADNVRWILDTEGPGARVLVRADHDQVASAGSGPGPSMGQHLRQALGTGYVAIGQHFGRSTAHGAARSGTVEATFTGVAPSPWILDLRRAPASGPVRAWLVASHPVRDVRPGERGVGIVEVRAVLAGRLDAVLFHDELAAENVGPGRSSSAAPR